MPMTEAQRQEIDEAGADLREADMALVRANEEVKRLERLRQAAEERRRHAYVALGDLIEAVYLPKASDDAAGS